MKKTKKGISVFLIFCMLLPLLPAMALAAPNMVRNSSLVTGRP